MLKMRQDSTICFESSTSPVSNLMMAPGPLACKFGVSRYKSRVFEEITDSPDLRSVKSRYWMVMPRRPMSLGGCSHWSCLDGLFRRHMWTCHRLGCTWPFTYSLS